MFHNFLFLQYDVGFGIVNAFSWIFVAVSREKIWPTLMLFLLTYIEFRTVEFFPPAELWVGEFKFNARQPYARILLGPRNNANIQYLFSSK